MCNVSYIRHRENQVPNFHCHTWIHISVFIKLLKSPSQKAKRHHIKVGSWCLKISMHPMVWMVLNKNVNPRIAIVLIHWFLLIRCWKKTRAVTVYLSTLNLRGPSFPGLFRRIPWLLMSWIFVLPGYRHLWNWLYRIGMSLFYTTTDCNCLCTFIVRENHIL